MFSDCLLYRKAGMALKQLKEHFGVCHTLLIILGTCASVVHSGNSGREFVFAPLPNQIAEESSIGVVLQPSSDEDVTINIFVRGISLDVNITLLSGSGPYDYPLPNSLIYHNVSGKINSTVVITSDNDIFVLAYNMKRYTSDVFTVIPQQNLGQEYFIATITWEDNPSDGEGVISISASRDNTYLEIFLNSTVEFENDKYYAGDVIRYTLLPYETIQLLPHFINITGSRVLANASLVVSVGAKYAEVPTNVIGRDHLAEQLAPFSAWGKVFVISPLAARTSGYILQIIAGRDNTKISYEGLVINLNMGNYVTVDILNQEMLVVSADKPISIMQYSTGADREQSSSRNGDPSVMRVIPIEQYVNMATFPVYKFSSQVTAVRSNYLGITARCEYTENINVWKDDILLKPLWISNYTVEVLDGTGFCSLWTAVYNGVYTLKSQGVITGNGHEMFPKFSAAVYAIGYFESFWYRAASDDRTLTRPGPVWNIIDERDYGDLSTSTAPRESASTGSSISSNNYSLCTVMKGSLIAGVSVFVMNTLAI